LAKEGIILSQYYVQQVCSPSRAALMTGMYPYHIGRQKGTIKPLQPTGLSLARTLLPEELGKLGYTNHIVGKWHLGFCKWEYTPTWRGFHNFYGYYTGAESYFDHERANYLDFRNNMNVNYEAKGTYSTELFAKEAMSIIKKHKTRNPFFLYLPFQAVHAPLEAPIHHYKKVKKTGNAPRDIYRAMLASMDLGVSKIVQKLKDTGHWKNTLLVFTTDNGGAVSMAGSNHPLRGTKGTLFEGGTHGAGFVSGGRVPKSGATNSALMHITDWYPTLLSVAGNTSVDTALDGINQWEVIRDGLNSSRKEMVYNLKMVPSPQGAIRVGPYKLMFANKFNKDGWYNIDATKSIHHHQCQKLQLGRKHKKEQKRREKKNMKYKKLQYMNRKKDSLDVLKCTEKSVLLRDGGYAERLFNIKSEDENDEFDEFLEKEIEEYENEEYNKNSTDSHIQRMFDRKWPKLKKHLFNILEDPEERNDLKDSQPEIVEMLRIRVRELLGTFVDRDYPDPSNGGKPKHFHNVWSPGWCE